MELANNWDLQDHLAGALAGMVLGDAFGVPGELWPREKVRERFGDITKFLDGPEDNIVACYFKAGHYTDDSAQAFVILNAMLTHGCVPEPKVLADDLLDWVRAMNGFEINLLGPSSKAALLAWSEGRDPTSATQQALTNGAAMRIAPVGCFFKAGEEESLARTAAAVSRVTHASDVTIAGASMVAAAVAGFSSGAERDEVIGSMMKAHDYAMTLGAPTWAASVKERFKLALNKIDEHPDEEEMSLWIYQVLGTGTMTSESVSAALAVAFYARDVKQAAHICANMGGDTDTIGAMACSIVGARDGLKAFDAETVDFLQAANNINFEDLALRILSARESFKAE